MKKIQKFIFNNIYIIFTILFITIILVFFLFVRFNLYMFKYNQININELVDVINLIAIIFIIIVVILILLLIYVLRKIVVNFSDEMCKVIDKVILKEEVVFNINNETILSKLQCKLKNLVDIIDNDRIRANIEKDNVKSLVADISHQIKTPIANISIYNETLLERDLNKEQQKMCLKNMKFQVSKLEWLVKALIKMSRLENNIISLNMNEGYLNETIAIALSGIYLKAEEKNINLSVKGYQEIKINHDSKWTSEALFNILENAVKYTNNNGIIEISVDKGELFTKVDIKDSGIGIEENEINNVFKRFYRGSEVLESEGVGIGLYLANEIITKQGGYIKLKSKKGEGTTFSVFFNNLE